MFVVVLGKFAGLNHCPVFFWGGDRVKEGYILRVHFGSVILHMVCMQDIPNSVPGTTRKGSQVAGT